jgi:cytochrome c553
MLRLLLLLTILAVPRGVSAEDILAGAKTVSPPADAKAIEFFESKVRPILADRCLECHGPEKQKGNLKLDSLAGMLKGGDSGPALALEKPDESLLLQVIGYASDIKMPPKSKLPEREIADLTQWVKRGAPWPNSQPSGNETKRTAGGEITAEQRAFWAFQPPREPILPIVERSDWPQTPIDRFILARLEAAGLEPAAPAGKRTLIRRATFDLAGIPPTAAEVADFLADEFPDAFAKVIDRLLASPRYGERWGRHWLDVARYADSNGLDENLAYASAYRYRDYVISAFNRDKRFNRFVEEQIAGDLLPVDPNGDPSGDTNSDPFEGLIATGFLCLGAKMLAEDDPVKMQMDIVDEQVDTIGRAFLGLTLGCARCHAHKFDPIPTEDYYSLAGIFKSTRTMENFSVVARWQERPLAPPDVVKVHEEHRQKIKEKQAEISRVVDRANQQLLREARMHAGDYLAAAAVQHESSEILKAAQPIGASPSDGYRLNPEFVRQWLRVIELPADEAPAALTVWHVYRQTGKLPAVETSPLAARFVDLKPASWHNVALRYADLFAEAERAWQELEAASPAPTAKELVAKELADPALESLRKLLHDPKGPLAVSDKFESYYAADEQTALARFRAEANQLQATLPKMPEAMAVSDGKVEDLRVHLRGSHLTLGELVPRQFPAIFGGDRKPLDSAGSGRRELAHWLADPRNPLTSRVIVNRIWLWHFGEGLVRSPDNFGSLGERPTHPELLDWLALRFVEQGWSLKSLHRTIMLSATYQQSSTNAKDAISDFGYGISDLKKTNSDPDVSQAQIVNPKSEIRNPKSPSFVDPENRLLWRFNRRRLEAEALRDSLLATCGELDAASTGSLLPTPNRQYVTGTGSNLPAGLYDSRRRSVYLPVVRSALYDVFQAFDFADPTVMNGRRDVTTVAPQALFMMNSPLVSQATRSWAIGLLRERFDDDSACVQVIYEQAYSRPPSTAELSRALSFVERYRESQISLNTAVDEARLRSWQSLCRAVLSANEFVYVE